MTAPMNIEPRKEHCTTPLHRKKLIWHGKKAAFFLRQSKRTRVNAVAHVEVGIEIDAILDTPRSHQNAHSATHNRYAMRYGETLTEDKYVMTIISEHSLEDTSIHNLTSPKLRRHSPFPNKRRWCPVLLAATADSQRTPMNLSEDRRTSLDYLPLPRQLSPNIPGCRRTWGLRAYYWATAGSGVAWIKEVCTWTLQPSQECNLYPGLLLRGVDIRGLYIPGHLKSGKTSNITPNISRGLTTPFRENYRRETYSFCMPSSSASPERKALLEGVELEATQRSRQATQPLGHNGWGACPWKWRVYASVVQPSPSFPWMGLTQVYAPVHAVTWLSPARARAPKRASEYDYLNAKVSQYNSQIGDLRFTNLSVISKRSTSAELLHCGLEKIDLKDTHHGYDFSFVIPRREDMALHAPSTIQTLGSRRDWGRNIDASAGKPVPLREKAVFDALPEVKSERTVDIVKNSVKADQVFS
ncbi:hypothetical protein FA13DRAFT_1717102 [Coprinellus micaceus]|uniref:Uncharacterized protein n=1 Tax=Coprinellus micaceus TaxID=71717 RepID=A0A4Y7SJ75_COPMI|nr:hypothetical protein FA13DRAFT_1717102 [Coprinellus micaceus]